MENRKVFWSYDSAAACLTVSGEGKMENWEDASKVPWRPYLDDIRSVVIEEGVTSVGNYAFSGCGKLTDITLAGTVEVLGVYSFASCTSLISVKIPEGVRVIAARAFWSCVALKEVYLPSTLSNIDMRAFGNDDALATVYYSGTKTSWNRILISMAASDNRYLLGADIHYQGSLANVCGLSRVNRYRQIVERVKAAICQGGDGKLYITAPNLTEPGIRAKSGDCTLIVFPDGQTMIIDAGFTACSGHIIDLLRDLELTYLDYFVLSHSHDDHAGGSMAVAEYLYGHEGGGIGNYYRSSHVSSSKVEPLFSNYLQERCVNMCTDVEAGVRLEIGGVTIDVFNPAKELVDNCTGKEEELNNISILMKFTYGEAAYLTGGDLYREREAELVDIYGDKLQAVVMKANHHGTHTSSCEKWLKAVSPEVILALADDIGCTPLAWQHAENGIAYYSVGIDGLVMVQMEHSGSYHVVSQYDSTLRQK